MAEILGISLYNNNIHSAVEQVVTVATSKENRTNRCISATGAHGIVYAYKKLEFKKVLNSFYMNLPDGMPGVWVGNLKGEKKMRRCYGPDFFKEVMMVTSNLPIKHFLCGGKEGVADELRKSCLLKFKNNNVVGTFSPPFREMTDEEMFNLGNEINATGADIVWIGLSTPKQEIFASRLALFTNVHFIVTVGAAFDFHTDRVKSAPRWMQVAGLEWFFRLMVEPQRLFRRYAEIVPLFIYYNLREFIYFCVKAIKT